MKIATRILHQLIRGKFLSFEVEVETEHTGKTVKFSTILIINSIVLKHLTVLNSSQKSRTWFQAMSKFHAVQNINQLKSENPNLVI